MPQRRTTWIVPGVTLSAAVLTGWLALGAVAHGADTPQLEVVPDPAVLPALSVHCKGVESGWRTPAPGRAREVMAALRAFPWRQRGFLPPLWECHTRLELRCAADLDADGEPEWLARLQWSSRPGGTCGAAAFDPALQRYEVVAILSRGARNGRALPRVIDIVSHGAPRPAGSTLAPLAFVRLPSGRAGLRGESPSDPTGGCDLGGVWVGVVARNRFVLLPSGAAAVEPCP